MSRRNPTVEEINRALLEGSLLLTESGLPALADPEAPRPRIALPGLYSCQLDQSRPATMARRDAQLVVFVEVDVLAEPVSEG